MSVDPWLVNGLTKYLTHRGLRPSHFKFAACVVKK